MHEVSHNVLTQNYWFVLPLLGLGGASWQAKHLKHHRVTNQPHDPELIVSPLFRLHPKQELCCYHRYQHVYAWPLYSLLHFSLWKDILCGVSNPWRGASYHEPPFLVKFIRASCFLWLHVVWPWQMTGSWHLFLYEWLFWTLPSLWITICFQASHVMASVIQNQTTWDSMAWCADSVWVTEITGGLNLQPYHHKYPYMPHTSLLAIRDATPVKDRALETTFLGAVKEHYLALKLLGE